jgi:hypothetical protein
VVGRFAVPEATKPLAQSTSQPLMLRLPKKPIRVSTTKRPAETKLMIFGGHRGRAMAMLISATAKATRAPHAIPSGCFRAHS